MILRGILLKLILENINGWYLQPKGHHLSEKKNLNSIGNAVDFYSKTYQNVLLLGDFNITESREEMHAFLEDYHPANLVHFATYLKMLRILEK